MQLPIYLSASNKENDYIEFNGKSLKGSKKNLNLNKEKIIKFRIYLGSIRIYYLVENTKQSFLIKNDPALRKWLNNNYDLQLGVSIFSAISIFILSIIFLGLHKILYHFLFSCLSWLIFFYFIESLNQSIKTTNARFAFIGILFTLPLATWNSVFLLCLIAFVILFVLSSIFFMRKLKNTVTSRFMIMLYWVFLNIVLLSGYATFISMQLSYDQHQYFLQAHNLNLKIKKKTFQISNFIMKKQTGAQVNTLGSVSRFLQNQNMLLQKMPYQKTYIWRYKLMAIDAAFTVLSNSAKENIKKLHKSILTYADIYFHPVAKKSVTKINKFISKKNKYIYHGFSFNSYNRISKKVYLQHCISSGFHKRPISFLVCFNAPNLQDLTYYFNAMQRNRIR